MDSKQEIRYARHLVLKEIRQEGQEKLLASKVLVIGAGGLGSPVIMYLAAAGVGTIGIADSDRVDLSNLQRQIIHNTDSVGKLKTLSAKNTALGINPDINICIHDVYVTADNINEIISPYDFVIDCTDSFETKFLINDACVRAKKPYSHGGAVRFEGQAMTYVPGKGPCLRCLMGDVPEYTQTCRMTGVLGAAVGVIGSVQAMEAVKYITGAGELLCGKVFSFDGLTMKIRVHNMPNPDPACPVCGVLAQS